MRTFTAVLALGNGGLPARVRALKGQIEVIQANDRRGRTARLRDCGKRQARRSEAKDRKSSGFGLFG